MDLIMYSLYVGVEGGGDNMTIYMVLQEKGNFLITKLRCINSIKADYNKVQILSHSMNFCQNSEKSTCKYTSS